MKDLIALCAVFVLLMTFPIQYALNTKNHYTISIVQKHVNNAKEQSRLEGCFTDTIKKELIDKIAEDTGLDTSDVQITATGLSDRKSRGSLLHYEVSIPLKQIIATNKFWGISDSENAGRYVIENYAVSEWVSP